MEESLMEPIEAEARPMSLNGTKVFKTSGESKGLDRGVEPKAAFTRNLKKKDFLFLKIRSLWGFFGTYICLCRRFCHTAFSSREGALRTRLLRRAPFLGVLVRSGAQ